MICAHVLDERFYMEIVVEIDVLEVVICKWVSCGLVTVCVWMGVW